MSGRAAEPGRSVLSRVMAVLGAFDGTHRELTATQVADRASLPLSTTHRVLTELVQHGALTRMAAHYGIGEEVVVARVFGVGLPDRHRVQGLSRRSTAVDTLCAPGVRDDLAVAHANVSEANPSTSAVESPFARGRVERSGPRRAG